jgi:hypothetical protein
MRRPSSFHRVGILGIVNRFDPPALAIRRGVFKKDGTVNPAFVWPTTNSTGGDGSPLAMMVDWDSVTQSGSAIHLACPS